MKKSLVLALLGCAVLSACGGGPSGSNPSDCKLNGSWSLTIGGQAAAINLAGGGTYGLSVNGAEPQIGDWSLEGGTTFKITDEQCGTTQGSYAATFSADCKTVTMEVKSDGCEGRRNSVDGTTWTKR